MEVLKNTRLDLWIRVMHKKKELIMRKPFSKTKVITIILVLTLVANLLCQGLRMDVKTVLFNGDSKQLQVYMEKTQGYEVRGKYGYACKLDRSFYRLK
jgi:hypothetical protein